MTKKRLDYLAIPDGGKKAKKEKIMIAIKEIHKRSVDKVLILKGKDSEEDILYLGKILKKGDRIGFDTFPLHYEEYKEIIKKAKKEGKFPKGVKIENIKTAQPFKQFIYGKLGLAEEKIKKGKIEFMEDRKEKFLPKIKGVVKKILG